MNEVGCQGKVSGTTWLPETDWSVGAAPAPGKTFVASLSGHLDQLVRRHFGTPGAVPRECREFLEQVAAAYEESLREKEYFLERSQQVARLGAYKFDVATGTWVSSRSLDNLFGIGADYPRTVEGWLQRVVPADRESMREYLVHHVLEGRNRFDREYRIRRHGDGAELWVRGLGELEFDRAGRPIRLIGTLQDISAQRRAEEALAFSQERLALAMSATNDGIWDWHVPTDRGYFSPGYWEMLGYEVDEMGGGRSTWAGMLHPDDLESAQRTLNECLAGVRQHYAIEYRMRSRTSEWVWILSRGKVVERDADGRAVRVMVTHSDISDRKQMEQELRESEERLRLAMHAANQGLFDLDLVTGEAVVSDEYARMLGYEPAEFRESNDAWRRRLHPDDQAPAFRAFTDYIDGSSREYRVEFRQRTRTGEWRWILALGKILARDDRGRPTRLLGTHTDITDRKRAEEALAEREERLRQAVRVSQIGIFDHDHTLGRIYYSPEIRTMHGVPQAEVVSVERVVQTVHPADRERVAGAIRRSHDSRGNGQYECEYRAVRADGSLRWAYARGETFFAGEGGARRPVRTVGAVVDITERKEAVELLARSRDELEARVAERTRELAQAKRAAEAASEAKSRFLAMMSHEIRTPLNGVAGVLHLLRKEPLSGQQLRWIDMASTSASTLLYVINDILDFSKVEAGMLDLHRVPTDLREMVGRLAAGFQQKAEAQGLTWDLHLDPTVPDRVRVDPDRLIQILGNLLGNALKFTKSGAVSLAIGSAPAVAGRPSGEGRRWVRFSVSDTGPGIAEEDLERLFKPFSQVDNSTTRSHGGTGLGLGICKQLVELMGGAIGVDSVAGQGSTFWFDLPFEEIPATGGASRASPAVGPAIGPSTPEPDGEVSRPIRVLLAEDNEINQELAREMVRFAGFECDCVTRGDDAVKAAAGGRYDLVFMDCMMPGMDGYEASRAIRHAEARRRSEGKGGRRLAIVAMTANAMAGDREKCLAAGMDDYLPKPLDPDEVARVLRRWVPVSASSPGADGAAGLGGSRSGANG